MLKISGIARSLGTCHPAIHMFRMLKQAKPGSALIQVFEEAIKESHSISTHDDKRNREYLIKNAALCDNATQEEMEAVVAYGLEQHRINFPDLY